MPWLSHRERIAATDDPGGVIRVWRTDNHQSQADVAAALGMTQQHLSQIEKGKRPLSLEQRRRAVEQLGISPQELGLSSGQAGQIAPREDENPEVASSQMHWRGQRRWLNQHRSTLAQLAVQLYPAEHRIPDTPLIAHPDWLIDEPIELESLRLALDEEPQSVALDGSESASQPVRPLHSDWTHFDRYSSAIKHLDPPRLFESRPSYRLLETSLGHRHMRFGLGAYFDKLDVSETLAHEIAAACMTADAGLPSSIEELSGRLPFRELIDDPFDMQRRDVIPAITTLTIRLRRYPAEPSFLLHWRDPGSVATAGGVYDVIPAGEFQPSSVAIWDRRNDFDLWRNVVREYAEELLGEPEHDGTRSQPINYDAWPLFEALEQARRDGGVTAYFLGLALDALTLAATILTVVVIDDDVFSRVFGSTVRFNDEGEVIAVQGSTAAEGVPFTESAVERMLTSEPMASPGAGCLALAWKHRDVILGL